MNHILPCFQKLLHLFFQPKQIQSQSIASKYSRVDTLPSCQQNKVSGFQQLMPNSYTGLENAQIVIMPDVQSETNKSNSYGNLLINKCQGGRFFILRGLENVYIDTCQNISAFIGPCNSTLFIRNCKNIKIRSISQQLRIQNSQNITIEGIVGVKPVLQSCRLIKFYAMTCRMYEDLIWQIQKAKINVFENQIYQCYDFTPRKLPNFSNGQIQEGDFDTQWQATIQMNDLDWQFKNVYLPQLTSIKKSMLKKFYDEKQIKSNNKIIILMAKMNFKQFLSELNCSQLHKNFVIIQKLGTQQCLKLIKNTTQYKQKVVDLSKKQGQWYFLIGKFNKNVNKSNIGITIIDQRNLVWKIFNSQQR